MKKIHHKEHVLAKEVMRRKMNLNGVSGVWIESVPDQTIHVTTTQAQENKMKKISEIRWRESNPEPEFTITMHENEKLTEMVKNKNLTQCGRIFAAIIHTNFKQKETGLLVMNGKPMKQADFGKIFKLKSKQAITDALKEMVKDGILIKEKTKYFLNKEYHFMGKVMEKTVFSKIYHKTNRELLENVSQEAVGLLYKIIPLVNYINGSVCSNPEEADNEQVKVLIREDLAEYLDVHPNTVSRNMEELIEQGVILPIQIKNSVYYKVHPDFVCKIDYFAAQAITMMIDEHKAVQKQLAERRKSKKKQQKEKEGE